MHVADTVPKRGGGTILRYQPLNVATGSTADTLHNLIMIVVRDDALDHGQRHDADLAVSQIAKELGVSPATSRCLDPPPGLR
jgi:hypothetical protein